MGLALKHLQKIDAGLLNVALATLVRAALGIGVDPAALVSSVAPIAGRTSTARSRVAGRTTTKAPAGPRAAAVKNPTEAPDDVLRAIGARISEFRKLRQLSQ